MQIFPHLPACAESAGGLRTFSDRWIKCILLELLNEDVISSVWNLTWTLVTLTLTRKGCGFQLSQKELCMHLQVQRKLLFLWLESRAESSQKSQKLNQWMSGYILIPFFAIMVYMFAHTLLSSGFGSIWRVFVLLEKAGVLSALLDQHS